MKHEPGKDIFPSGGVSIRPRPYPATLSVSQQPFPVLGKPMNYDLLRTLLPTGIRSGENEYDCCR
jgi:dTDP-glucose pyrophosphorylase